MTDKFASIAIEELDSTKFERFAQFVVQTIYGWHFSATGGLHDGGLDGFFREGNNTHFFQASKQEGSSTKIRKTIKDIKKKRRIDELTYVTSQDEPDRDILEARIFKDTQVRVQIYDRKWLVLQCELYESLSDYLLKNSKLLKATVEKLKSSDVADDLLDKVSVLTFMEMEAASLRSSRDFNTLCVDSAIYEALEGTNPETEQFRSPEQIAEFIDQNYPKLLSKKKLTLPPRLAYLSSKSNSPRIRRHPPEKYSLPYELRDAVNERNLAIGSMQNDFFANIRDRIRAVDSSLSDVNVNVATTLVLQAMHKTYEQQAVNFIRSFSEVDEYQIRVFDIVNELIDQIDFKGDEKEAVREVSSTVFRHVCYSSSAEERPFLIQLMKYYSLRFVMTGDASIDQYFSSMAKKLRLYVGSDIIVRMLSEKYVVPESRAMTKSIGLLSSCGVNLFVTRQTVQEVYNHVKRSHLEFCNNHLSIFRHVTLDEAKNFDQILIRAFYYAFLEPDRHDKQPRDWYAFMSSFGGASWFEHAAKQEDSFGTWLIQSFPFKFVEKEEVVEGLDREKADELTDKILEIRYKGNTGVVEVLARNDAEMMLFIDRERSRNNERVSKDAYGMNTWWLTEETIVLKAARAIKFRDDTIMNPQFLMNRYFLDPTIPKEAADAEAATPSIFGLRITDRLTSRKMNRFLDELKDIGELDDATKSARVRAAANRLKQAR